MRKIAAILVVLVALIPGRATRSQQVEWPPLPEKGFISGRLADKQDIADGNAVFVAAVGGAIIGKPLQITIPQYAFWKDSAGAQLPVIVVQAEDAGGTQMIGFRDFSGKEYVGTLPEFTLLGTSRSR